MITRMTTKDYQCYFYPNVYLNTYYKDPVQFRFSYQQYANIFGQIKRNDLTFLEYGGGPVVSRLFSACPHVQYFVFGEYLEANRKAVEAWVNNKPTAFDWDRTFDFIAQEVEGRGPDEVTKRKAELRQKIRAIVSCDIKSENILELPSNLVDIYGPPYDVVATSLCIESVVETIKEFKDAVAKLAKLVKPGGCLVMHGILHQYLYTIGSKTFNAFKMDDKTIVKIMKNAGLKKIEITLASSDHINNKKTEDSIPYYNADLFVAHGRA